MSGIVALLAESSRSNILCRIPVLVFEIIAFLLALYKGVEQLRNGAMRNSGLLQMMIRDSFAYFFL